MNLNLFLWQIEIYPKYISCTYCAEVTLPTINTAAQLALSSLWPIHFLIHSLNAFELSVCHIIPKHRQRFAAICETSIKQAVSFPFYLFFPPHNNNNNKCCGNLAGTLVHSITGINQQRQYIQLGCSWLTNCRPKSSLQRQRCHSPKAFCSYVDMCCWTAPSSGREA